MLKNRPEITQNRINYTFGVGYNKPKLSIFIGYFGWKKLRTSVKYWASEKFDKNIGIFYTISAIKMFLKYPRINVLIDDVFFSLVAYVSGFLNIWLHLPNIKGFNCCCQKMTLVDKFIVVTIWVFTPMV